MRQGAGDPGEGPRAAPGQLVVKFKAATRQEGPARSSGRSRLRHNPELSALSARMFMRRSAYSLAVLWPALVRRISGPALLYMPETGHISGYLCPVPGRGWLVATALVPMLAIVKLPPFLASLDRSLRSCDQGLSVDPEHLDLAHRGTNLILGWFAAVSVIASPR